MLSIIAYGRNDPSSSNYHKRVALSLNGFAQLLTGPDDEILFTDWNTDDELATLPEAIADTLTPQARARLRVLRVRPRHHARLGAAQPVVEAVARNVALRRSNPRNCWILSTNTDIVPLLAQPGLTLDTLIGQLQDGHYVTPRVELPEGVWQDLPRTDPVAVTRILRDTAASLALDELMFGEDDVLVDNPGDFQLFLRRDLFAADGFNEDMLGSWHVDHNLARRMSIRYGPPRSLDDRLTAYHCSHHLSRSHAHRTAAAVNEAELHIHHLNVADLPHQRDRWGLPQDEIEEIRLDEGTPAPGATLARILGNRRHAARRAFYRESSFGGFAYEPSHVLPHLADLFRHRDPHTRIGYAGTRADAASMFIALAGELGFVHRIATTADVADRVRLTQRPEIQVVTPAEFARVPDAFVFEFGALRDRNGTYRPFDAGIRLDGVEVTALDDVFRLLEAVVAEERAAVVSPERPLRKIVTINAIHNAYELPVAQLLDAGKAPVTTRLRHGFAKMAAHPDSALEAGSLTEQLAARLGRSRPVSLAELAEMQSILAEIESGAEISGRLAASVRVNGPGLLAYLACESVGRTKDAEAVARLEAAVQSVLAEPPVPGLAVAAHDVQPGVAKRPLSGLAASANWDDVRWLGFAHGLAREISLDRPAARSGWIWERVQFLYALDRLADSRPIRSVLVVCELQEDLIERLMQQFEQVDLLDSRLLRGPDAGEPRPIQYFLGSALPQVGKARLLSSADFEWLANGHYDAILLPHSAGFAGGYDGFVRSLSSLEPKLAANGFVGFSSNVLLDSADPDQERVDLAFAAETGLLGRIVRATGFELADGIDMTLSSHDRGLIGPRDTPGLFAESGPDGIAWPGLFFLRKVAQTPASAWNKARRKRIEPELGDQTVRLHLSPGSQRVGENILVQPRDGQEMAFYGPYLHLPQGAYEARASLHMPAAGLGEKKVDGYLEVVAGDICLGKVPTKGSARFSWLKQTYILPFDVPDSFDGGIEVRAIVSCNAAVQYSDVVIARREKAP